MKLSGLIPGNLDPALQQFLQSVVSAFKSITTFDGWRLFENSQPSGATSLLAQQRSGTDWNTVGSLGSTVDWGSATIPTRVYGVASGGMSTLSSCAAVYTVPGGPYNVPANAASTIDFHTKILDTDNAVTVGGWAFKVPTTKPGLYFVSVTVGWNTGTLTSSMYATQIWKNGSAYQYALGAANPVPASNSNWFTTTANTVLALNAGDTISAGQVNNQTVGTPQIAGGDQWSSITIFRMPGS